MNAASSLRGCHSLPVWGLAAAVSFGLLFPEGARAFDNPRDDGHERRCDPENQPGPGTPSEEPCDECSATGSPVYLAGGNLVLTFGDLNVPGPVPLGISRTYNSQDFRNGLAGQGWTHSFEVRAIATSDGEKNTAIVRWPNGQRQKFIQQPDGSFSNPLGFQPTLESSPDGLVLDRFDGVSYEFDAAGQLARVFDDNGNEIAISYDSGGCLESMTSVYGDLVLSRGPNGKIASVTDSSGRIVTYTHDGNGNLTDVTDPLGNTTTYQYDGSNRLVQILDPLGRATHAVTYDSADRVNSLIDERGDFTYSYMPGAATKTDNTSGGQWRYVLDEAGVVLSTEDPLGTTEVRGYDAMYNLVALTDRNGNTTTSTYDLKGNELSATDPLGNTRTFTYNEMNLLTSATDPLGRMTAYEYDDRGNLLTILDPAGNTLAFSYDSNGNRTSETDQLGNTTTHAYDGFGNRLSTTSPTGVVTTFQYDDRGNMTSRTMDGGTATFTYDLLDRLTSTTDPEGGVETVTYDAAGDVDAITSARGGTTTFAADEYGRPTSRTAPDGAVTTYLYATTGVPVEPTKTTIDEPEGEVVVYRDPFDRVMRVVTPDGAERRYQYDGEGNLTAFIDPDGRTFSSAYDEVGRKVSESTADGLQITTAYNEDGTVDTIAEPAGNVVQYEYGDDGVLTRISDDFGVLAEPQFDAAGKPRAIVDGAGNVSTLSYDENLDSTGVVYPDGSGLAIERTDLGKIESAAFPSGTVPYQYDLIGRLTSMMLLDGNTISATYTPDGRVATLVDAAGVTKSFEYDTNGRFSRVTYPDGTTRSLTYRGSQITSMTGSDGGTLTFTYDESRRMSSVAYPDGSTSTYEYNGKSSLARAVNPVVTLARTEDMTGRIVQSTLGNHVVGYEYDPDGRTATITYPGGRQITRTVDARGRLIEIREGGDVLFQQSHDPRDFPTTATFGNGITATFAFGTDMNVQQIRYLAEGVPVVDLAYFSDASLGLITGVQDTVDPASSEQYIRDVRERLVGVRRGLIDGNGVVNNPVFERAWQLDAVGNWQAVTTDGSTETRIHNNLHQVVLIDGQALTYDLRGNLISDGTYDYAYDAENHLVEVRVAVGSPIASGRRTDLGVGGGGPQVVVSYEYDALGRRYRKTAGGVVTEYVYDGYQRVLEEWRDGALWASYVYSNEPGGVVTADIGGSRYFHHRNAQGSIVAITDETGAVVERYRYTPYGAVEAFDAQGAPVTIGLNTVLFTGLQYDPEVDLYYASARYYSPKLGRFISRDPLDSFAAGGIVGLYAYADLDPITFVDRTGLASTMSCLTVKTKVGVPTFGLGFVSRFMGTPKGEFSLETKTCQKCCSGSGRKVTESSITLSANVVWDPPCVPVVVPWPLGVKTPDGGCAGIFFKFGLSFGGSAFFKEDKCANSCQAGGCLTASGSLTLGGGFTGTLGEAFAGGNLTVTGQGCIASTCRTGPDLKFRLCVSGKVFVKIKLKKWWWFDWGFDIDYDGSGIEEGRFFYEHVFFEGKYCARDLDLL